MILENSLALHYIKSKGWNYKQSSDDRVELEYCPYCKKDNYGHFYVVVDSTNKDGLHMCHKCGKTGNLTSLKEFLGDKIKGVDSRSDWASKERKIEELPDTESCHKNLLSDIDTLDYLINSRGFSVDIIKQQKLGLTERYFRECGKVKALIYPYLVNGNTVFVHYRSLPPSPKAFSSPMGWEVPLYNGEILKEGLSDLVLVEGEANVIAALDKGITNLVGVPGANTRKAMWLEALDQLGLEKVYICYDKDKAGQKAAQTLASRIGIEKCLKIMLPDFTITLDNGETKNGKDLNEWFVYGGGTQETFEKLKEEATLFDIQGVSSCYNALDELEEQLNGKETLAPTYRTPWVPLNRLIGFENGDVIDIVAPEKIGKTTVGMNLMEFEVDTYNEDGIIICFEMPVVRMARKWVSHVTNTNDSIPKTHEEAKIKLDSLKLAVQMARQKASSRDSDLYFCYPQIKEIDDVYKLIIDCIRRYGVKWVMIDNLQLICDRTLKSNQNRTIHLSQISKTLAAITKDYGIKMVRILQPHRVPKGAMVTSDNVDGSSQVAKDCDCMFTADRVRVGEMSKDDFESTGYVEEEISFDPKMKLSVALSRYSCGGYVTVYFDGATSTVRDFDEKEKVAIEPAKPIMGYDLPKEQKVATAIVNPELAEITL
jgi:hypothetical protein